MTKVSGNIVQLKVSGNIVQGAHWAAYWTGQMIDSWSFDSSSQFSSGLSDVGFQAYNTPSAQYYNGKTYITYQGNDDDPYIIYYNHSLKSWALPVKIGINPLSNGDVHGPPCLLVDSSGYIHVMWGAHNSAFQYSKSHSPEDIGTWDAQASPASGTYVQLIEFSNSDIYLFKRHSWVTDDWGYVKSSDGGATWGAYVSVIVDFAYCLFKKGIGDTIHVGAVGSLTTGNDLYNIYYLFFNGTVWKNRAGTTLTLPVGLTETSVKIYDSGINNITTALCSFNVANQPYIYFMEGTGIEIISTYTYKIIKPDNSVVSLGVTTPRFSRDSSYLDVRTHNQIDVCLTTGGASGLMGGKVELWTSNNGGNTWSLVKRLATGNYIAPLLVKDYNKDGRLIFCEFAGTPTTWTRKGYLWGDSGFIKNLSFVSAAIADLTPDKVDITFNQVLDDSSISATTDFTLAGKTITEVAITGAVCTLTVSVAYEYGNTPTISYTQPTLNPLKTTEDWNAGSFTDQTIANNIGAPHLTVINDGHTAAWYVAQDLSNITKDAETGEVSLWKDKLASGHNLNSALTRKPIWSIDGILFDGINDRMETLAFTLAQPTYIYAVLKPVSRTSGERFWDGLFQGTNDVGSLAWVPNVSENISIYAGTGWVGAIDLTVGLYHVIIVKYNGANSNIIVDNVAGTEGDAGSASMGGFTLGNYAGSSAVYSNNQFQEIIIRNIADVAGDITILYNYLKDKYGL